MLSYAGVQMFMDKLNHLIHSNDVPSINNPAIIRQRTQFQLLYDELHNLLFQTLFMDEHLEIVADLKKIFIDAAQQAEYQVDLFLSAVHIRNLRRSSFKYVFNLFLSCVHIRSNGHFSTYEDFSPSLDLDDVRRSFNLVKVELTSMNITVSSPIPETKLSQTAPVSFTRNPQGSKKLIDEIVVGLDRDLELIRDKLVEDQKKVDVVSIVGMGGIGKTTLATKVFHDSYVKHHFHVRVWVTISQTYNKQDVLIQILESIRGQRELGEENNESQLRELVHKNLMDKRYLIIIDDIWHIETWDNLKLFFPHDNNGSRILLTTRLTEVAKHANSDGLIHPVGYLSTERSWELLCKKAFHDNECPGWSIKPGMEIVENCKGLPLALAIIGGVLVKGALSEKFWVDIAERTGSYIIGDDNGCLETLALSYSHLPLHLRECFLYLGGFPEDYEYQVRTLIWLWVAEGFIKQDGNRSLEDIAEGYLIDLIDRNLVNVARRSKSSGVVTTCKLHDLVRELCLKKGIEERFFNEFPNNITTTPYKPTRMFINTDVYIQDFPYPSVKSIRAILWFGGLVVDIARCFHSFALLRVLDLHNYSVGDIPKSIELLVHLRYLAYWNSSKEFPSSICNLWNLQTLIYNTEHLNTVLPNNVSDLVNLRHLWTNTRFFIIPYIERPMKLQTIRDGFKSLTYLEKLKLVGFVHNHITFPASLKALTLEWCHLQWTDMSIIQSLPYLQVLKLSRYAFEGSCWNTDGQEFPQLKFLRLLELDIQQWEVHSASFPCLSQLEITDCCYLEEIPLEIGEIPVLELIKIKYCNHSVDESVRRIQEEQQNFGNYDLKIDIVNYIQENMSGLDQNNLLAPSRS